MGPQIGELSGLETVSYLLDTNICSAHMRRPAGLAHRFMQHSGQLAILTIVLGELGTETGRLANAIKLGVRDQFRKAPHSANAIIANAEPACEMKCLLSLYNERVIQRPLSR